MSYQILIEKISKLWSWILTRDYSNPRVSLIAASIIILPLIAKYLVLTGLLIGICLSISILYIVEHLPKNIKSLIHNNPVVSDLVLSSLGIVIIGSYLGTGLTLGLGFIFLDIILHFTLPIVSAR